MSSNTLIELKSLYKIFHAEDVETYAVNGIDLSIQEGEYLAITGPSGCGKSTLLSILGLLDKPSKGEYCLKGQNTSTFNRQQLATLRNRELGFVFQSFNLIESMKVIDNVMLPLQYRTDLSSNEIQDRAEAALTLVGMDHRRNHLPTQLSGGQQQRVAFARAIIGKPSLILADEPTGNLDSKSAETVMELLRQQHKQGVTVCIVTHDPRYTQDATRTIELLDGQVKEDGNRVSCDKKNHAAVEMSCD